MDGSGIIVSHSFKAEIEIIGINPYVSVPEDILQSVFEQAGRTKSPIPVCGTVNDRPYKQTLVRYQGAWRLYINLIMLDNSPKKIGEMIDVSIAYDSIARTFAAHPELIKALAKNKQAKEIFDRLTPSLRNEVIKYINNLKTEESIRKNVDKAIDFLLGKGRFVGRESIPGKTGDR